VDQRRLEGRSCSLTVAAELAWRPRIVLLASPEELTNWAIARRVGALPPTAISRGRDMASEESTRLSLGSRPGPHRRITRSRSLSFSARQRARSTLSFTAKL
jgi:hypothetical protein